MRTKSQEDVADEEASDADACVDADADGGAVPVASQKETTQAEQEGGQPRSVRSDPTVFATADLL